MQRTCAACKGERKIEGKWCPYCIGTGDDMCILEVFTILPGMKMPILVGK